MVFDQEFNVIYVRVVQGCNLNCEHCFTFGNKDPFKLADLNDIFKYLKSIKENVNPRKAVFYIHGGETFLAPVNYLSDVNKIINEIFKDVEIHIIPQTNLLINLTEDHLNLIKYQYHGEIGVSWDYKIRFNEERFSTSESRFFENLATLLQNGINVAISITVQKKILELDPIELVQKFEGVASIDFELLTIFDEKTKNLKISNIEWAKYLRKIVNYYISNETTWSLPQIDLFTKSILENKLYRCKCDCCNNRTFTMNSDGTVGLCPDKTYYSPISTVDEMFDQWEHFYEKALPVIAERESAKVNPVCLKCEFYDICGGNCENSLFVEGEDECPLSKSVIEYQVNNLNKFTLKLNQAYNNLPEL